MINQDKDSRWGIRMADHSDLVNIVPLLEQLGYPVTLEDLTVRYKAYISKNRVCYVYDNGNFGLLGFIAISITPQFHDDDAHGRITALRVDADHRGAGIGGTLIQFAKDYCRERGCKKLELTTNLKRLETHSFYRSNSMVETHKHFVINL